MSDFSGRNEKIKNALIYIYRQANKKPVAMSIFGVLKAHKLFGAEKYTKGVEDLKELTLVKDAPDKKYQEWKWDGDFPSDETVSRVTGEVFSPEVKKTGKKNILRGADRNLAILAVLNSIYNKLRSLDFKFNKKVLEDAIKDQGLSVPYMMETLLNLKIIDKVSSEKGMYTYKGAVPNIKLAEKVNKKMKEIYGIKAPKYTKVEDTNYAEKSYPERIKLFLHTIWRHTKNNGSFNDSITQLMTKYGINTKLSNAFMKEGFYKKEKNNYVYLRATPILSTVQKFYDKVKKTHNLEAAIKKGTKTIDDIESDTKNKLGFMLTDLKKRLSVKKAVFSLTDFVKKYNLSTTYVKSLKNTNAIEYFKDNGSGFFIWRLNKKADMNEFIDSLYDYTRYYNKKKREEYIKLHTNQIKTFLGKIKRITKSPTDYDSLNMDVLIDKYYVYGEIVEVMYNEDILKKVNVLGKEKGLYVQWAGKNIDDKLTRKVYNRIMFARTFNGDDK